MKHFEGLNPLIGKHILLYTLIIQTTNSIPKMVMPPPGRPFHMESIIKNWHPDDERYNDNHDIHFDASVTTYGNDP